MSIKSYFKGIRKRLKARRIYNHIDKHCGSVIEPYLCGERSGSSSVAEDLRVWVFWAQGIESAPDIVKICNRQLREVCSGSVVNLDWENYTDYVQMPPHILRRVERGEISLTHFSDILRVSLLAVYGGLWIDSTCFVTCDLHAVIGESDIFTFKSSEATLHDMKYIARNRWAIWGIGTRLVGCELFVICRDIFFKYWEVKDRLIDYYLVDHTLSYVYDNLDSVREMIDGCGYLEKSRATELMDRINERYEKEALDKLMLSAPISKLSYKKPLAEGTEAGELTLYAYLLGKTEK